MAGDSLLVVKLASLLHDPAWKPWVVSAAFGGVGRVLARKTGSGEPAGARHCKHLVRDLNSEADAHELDAAAAALNILEPLGEKLAKRVAELILDGRSLVSEADRLAAALDRWVLTYRRKELRNARVGYGEARYVNPLDPRFAYKPTTVPQVGAVCRFVEKLRGIVEALLGAPLPLLYNVLLFSLEPMWYSVCRGCVPLADTRTPTHTVFDHVYAACSMTNWLYPEGGLGGFMVKLDVAGIQEFISSARKTRDLWAGSWLVSALAWYTVAEAVMLLGADIVLSPYPLANHFFIATLLKELESVVKESGADAGKSIVEALLELDRLARDAFLWGGAANQPIVPGTFFLALPCIDLEEKQRLQAQAERMHTVNKDSAERLLDALAMCDEEKLRRYFTERFREAWQGVAKAVIGAYGSREEAGGLAAILESAGALDGWSKEEAERYLEAAAAEPPLRLRVVVVDVEKAYRKLLNEVREALQKPAGLADVLKKTEVNAGDAEELARKLLLHYMFSKAIPSAEEHGLEGGLALEPGYRIAETLEELTRRAFERPNTKPPGFHECSVCGRLPSVVYIGEGAREALRGLAGIPPSMFTEGERLCPYCLIRRLMTLERALGAVMDSLNLYKAENVRVYPRVPSTPELSVTSRYLALIEVLVQNQGLLNKIYESLEADLRKRGIGGLEKAEDYVAAPLQLYVANRVHDRGLYSRLLRVLGALEAYYDFSNAMGSGALRDADGCVDSTGLPREVCEALSEAARHTNVATNKYYTVVRGDGDLFGSCIVRGILDYSSPEDYVEKLLERGVENADARATLGRHYRSYARLLSLLAKQSMQLAEEPTVVITPSYYAALSRGQMLTALYDAAIVEALGGFPVYAGGDDVAALAPGNMDPEQLQSLVNAWLKARTGGTTLAATPLGLLPGHLRKLGTGSAAAAIVVLTRRNYWGLLGTAPGFHVTPVGAVYAAPVAYGRSYGVYVAHYRDPFQAVWAAAGELEELKDSVSACTVQATGNNCSETCSAKDMVFLSYGRVSGIAAREAEALAALPNLSPCSAKNNIAACTGGACSHTVAGPLEVSARLLEALRTRKVSRSILYDFEREAETAARLAERMRNCDIWARVATERLAAMLAERNSRQDAAEQAKRLATYCSSTYVKARDRTGLPLPWQLVRAVKVLYTAGR